MASEINELRLFVSSTFRDLQEEREYLVKKIFPAIRSICRERGVVFTEIDLRWGLSHESEGNAGRIVRTCLEEIDRCRPWFIGIIGRRYGWVPDHEELAEDRTLCEGFPWIGEVASEEVSILEMEFAHGAFNNKGERAIFYKRDDPVETIDNPERMSHLIERVRSSGFSLRSFNSPEVLGEMVRQDLLAVIDERWPAGSSPTALELENHAHKAFAASRRRAYIPNITYLDAFTAWVQSDDPPLIVGGASGMGKSALAAWLVDNYRRNNPSAFIIEHYVGATSGPGDHIGFLTRLYSTIVERYDLGGETIPSGIAEIEASVSDWLARVGATAGYESDRLLLVLDAIDQLPASSRLLDWLPQAVPANVRLIITSRVGEAIDHLYERGWPRIDLLPLSEEEREQVIVGYLSQYQKNLPIAQLQEISRHPASGSPLFLRTLAEELRLHGEHESLLTTISDYLSVNDLDGLFRRVLGRMEDDYGATAVEHVLSGIAVSRAGLTETDIMGSTGINRADLSTFLHALDYHLIRSDGRLSFFHDYLRRAILDRYLTGEKKKKIHHRLAEYFNGEFKRITDDGDSRSRRDVLRELLHQRAGADDRDELRRVLTSPGTVMDLFEGETEYEFLEWWKIAAEPSEVPGLYNESFLACGEERMAPERRVVLRLRLGGLFRTIGEWGAAEAWVREGIVLSVGEESSFAAAGYEILGTILQLCGRNDEAMESFRRQLESATLEGNAQGMTVASGNIGAIHLERGEYPQAMERYEEMMRVSQQRHDIRGLARARGKIGEIHLNRCEYDLAIPNYSESLDLYRKAGDRRAMAHTLGQIGLLHWNLREFDQAMACFTEESKTFNALGDRHGVATSFGKIGLVYLDQGDLDGAEECFRRYLDLTTDLGYARGVGFALGDIGIVRLRQGMFPEATDYFERALQTHQEIDFPFGVSMWLKWKGEVVVEKMTSGIAVDPDEIRSAEACLRQSIGISEAISKLDTLSEAEALLGRLGGL